jgi:hypothetical protein
MKSQKIYDESLAKKNNNIKQSNAKLRILDNSSFLFNLDKNTFSLKKNDSSNSNSFNHNQEENKKIIEFLKQQLLYESKEEFNFTITNDFTNLIKNYYIKKDASSLSMGVSQGKSTSEHFNSYFKDEDDEDEEKSEKDENEIITKNINIHESINDDINKLNEEMTFIKNQLIDFNKSFIESQRQLNLMIKDSITEQKQNNLSRESSSSNLFKVFTRSRRNSTSSKGSNGSNGSKDGRKSFDVEYKEFGSKSFKLDSNSLSKLNESQIFR